MMAEVGVGEAVGQQIECFQNRQSRADQGHKLLIENEKPLQVELFRTAQDSSARRDDGPARPDRIDEKSLLRVALAHLLLSAGAGRLLVNLTARIRVFEDKFHS